MIVCDRCGIYLEDDQEDDLPETCYWCEMHNWQKKQKWVTYEEREARKAAERAKVQPKPMPLPEGFNPSIIGDELSPHWDYALGAEIDSKSQRRNLIKDKGFVEESLSEHRQKGSSPHKSGQVVSYKGQKKHKSSAEREGVRTGDGKLVI